MPEFDIVDGVWTITPAEGKDIRFDTSGDQGHIRMSGVVKLDNNGGADPANALLMGVGTTASPATTAVADKNFIEMRTQSSATSGASRGMYWRHNLSGAGQSGECIRAFTDLTAAVATARGAQISLQIGDTGYVSGLGVGLDAQLYVKGAAVPANGTYAALNVEIYGEASADISAVTEAAFIRIVNSGNATAMGKVDDKAFLFDLSGFTSGAAKLWYDHQGSAPANIEEWLKIKTPAGTRWIPAYNAVV
jgi:hypothetical protein